MVLSTGWSDHCSVETGVTRPAATSSGPNRLSGRRRQAIMPAPMNGTVVQPSSTSRSSRW